MYGMGGRFTIKKLRTDHKKKGRTRPVKAEKEEEGNVERLKEQGK